MNRRLRVAVLMGGPSRERSVSLASGSAVAEALARSGVDVLPVRIEADRRWTLLPSPEGIGHVGAPVGTAVGTPVGTAVGIPVGARVGEGGPAALAQSPPSAIARMSGDGVAPLDAVFVALHGAFGEDGTVQGFLETLGIPFTGSGVAASALAMDKERTKEVLVHHGIRTAPWCSVGRAEWERDPAGCVERAAARTGFPAVVKPPRDGSSFGVTLAATAEELRAALAAALDTPDGRALVERRIEGVEVTCPVLGNSGGTLRTLPLVEIVPKGRAFFDYEAKYEGKSDEICPARVSEEVAARVREAAMTAHRVLGCDGVSRSDFIVPPDGLPVFLETNTVPGMTPQSLVPLAARAAGVSFEELCRTLLETAVGNQKR
ncbi:MAG: D-alanine--D-alanine ligase B [Planctomycetes bacterium]|nr:D-alanine--D-alanine ligase B [Planctomycetota bacterium]